MRIFTRIRQTLGETSKIQLEMLAMKHQLEKHELAIGDVFRYLQKMTEKKSIPRERIGYKPDQL
ncbi:MAG: hypothetical protein INR69_21835 [Mucilaginibacter polytrichastri]|nr:hypothetical protein [Mucilaginibacter polytrichastri]